MSKKIKNVCVYGVGGVGGYFGGKIAYEISKGKHAIQVYFIARGEHLKAIRKHNVINLRIQEQKDIGNN